MSIIGVLFAYYKIVAYKRDSKTKSKMLEQAMEEKEIELFYKRNEKQIKETQMMFAKFKKEFIDPFDENKTES